MIPNLRNRNAIVSDRLISRAAKVTEQNVSYVLFSSRVL